MQIAAAVLSCLKGAGPVKRLLLWFAGGLAVLSLAAFGALCYMAGSPRDAFGMVRYALPHMHRGTLQVGSDAPDVRLLALDGINHFHIRERLGPRPLVLVFGSFT